VLAGVSGCLMPRDLMPERMKQISLVTPHAWALDAYSQLLLSPRLPSLWSGKPFGPDGIRFGFTRTGVADASTR